MCGVIVGVGETDEDIVRARAGVKALLGFYGSTPAYRRVLEIEGREALQATLSNLVRQGQWSELADQLPEDLVDSLAICGTPQQCAEGLKAKVGDLADRVALFMPVEPSEATLAELVRLLKD
jgi:alkanesulfonate monooxygenase SsuD/methylene tetrahydromethanopterin reductase-like flavin-dependent oxidoreductase (luciferase family)